MPKARRSSYTMAFRIKVLAEAKAVENSSEVAWDYGLSESMVLVPSSPRPLVPSSPLPRVPTFLPPFVPPFLRLFVCINQLHVFSVNHYQSDTEVTIVWAFRGTDANVDLSKHTVAGVLSGKHNMIKEAMAAKTGTSPTKPNASHAIFPSIAIFLAGMSAYFLAF